MDISNLYGWAMSEYLPYGRFDWLKIIDKFDVNSVGGKSEIGYFLEVNFEYPDELHELLFLVICCQNIVKKFQVNIK